MRWPPKLPLVDLLETYQECRPLRQTTIAQMRRGVRRYSRWLRQTATVQHLTAKRLDKWVNAELEKCYGDPAETTLRLHRDALMALAREAVGLDLLKEVPDGVRRVPKAPPRRATITDDEFATLLATTRKRLHRHRETGCPRSLLMRAAFHVLRDTGLRPRDLPSLPLMAVLAKTQVLVRDRATQKPTWRLLGPETQRAFSQTVPPVRMEAFPFSTDYAVEEFRKFRRLAGLPRSVKRIAREGVGAAVYCPVDAKGQPAGKEVA